MDGPSIEHSDSDSGESWTLLENNSIYADEAPEFIEDKQHEKVHNEKDEDTDGISIISDSDPETSSPIPTPPDDIICNGCQVQENLSENNISDYVSVDPLLPDSNEDECEPTTREDILGDSHTKHKTYVHRRNKRLSTVLNIIVLGSVITAAGVAIGHMWGAKNDCTMQTSSSVNKILSNLYKLQEENAYLRNKLKELTFNNRQILQQKTPLKHNKCKKVFEESLSNNEPRKLTKCVDENFNTDNLMEHLTKPASEKEFIGDLDKLRTVYLQNKSWLDDEISRRMKIEEELVKKYNNEVNSAKDQRKTFKNENNEALLKKSDSVVVKKELLHKLIELENPDTLMLLQKKVTYADSLQPERNPRSKRNREILGNDNDFDWLTSKHNINDIKQVKSRDTTSNDKLKQDQTVLNHEQEAQAQHLPNDESEPINNNRKEQITLDVDWTEVKPKFRRNEERYESDYENFFLNPKQKSTHNKNQQRPSDEWTKQTKKNLRKKEKREKRNFNNQNSDVKKTYNSEGGTLENVFSEQDFIKDDRYVVNKLKKDKKAKGHINNNKKQKQKMKDDKFIMKGEYGEGLDTPDDYVLYYPEDNYKFDPVSFLNKNEYLSGNLNTLKDTSEKYTGKDNIIDKKTDSKAQGENWFEKRALFRTEARKRYYEQFKETSPNNSSWYFRRMRKREQCRAKGDNNTFKKVYKEKKNNK